MGEVFVNPQVDDYLDAVLRSGLFEMARQASPSSEGPKTIDDVYQIVYLRANQDGLFAVERFGCMC